MHLTGFFAYTLVILASAFLTKECQGALVPDTGAKPSNTQTLDDVDDDDFVPYQGERFSVFDWNLCKAMGQKYSGNVLLSPISIKLALVLLYEGAQDQTAQELASTMQLPVSRSATRDKFSTILQSLQTTSPSYTVNVGTRMYIDTGVLTRQRYGAIAKTFYAADVINANLSESRAVVDNVNSWVSNVTNGNIKSIVEDEDSVKDSVMLILNALYFKGTWRHNFFSPNNSHMGKFYTTASKNVDVEFMHTVGRFYYSESSELDAKIIRLPYEGHRYAMYLILPSSLTGLDKLVNDINPFIVTRHVWLMQDLPVEVAIPKFKFDFTSHLENILRELGIRDIFDNTATLTGIARTKRTSRHLLVSDVIQKTGIEVNEYGTSAYTVTEVHVGNKIADQTFFANHPFLFYIEDETTGTILYVGKITDPTQTVGTTGKVEFPTRVGEEIPQTYPGNTQ